MMRRINRFRGATNVAFLSVVVTKEEVKQIAQGEEKQLTVAC